MWGLFLLVGLIYGAVMTALSSAPISGTGLPAGPARIGYVVIAVVGMVPLLVVRPDSALPFLAGAVFGCASIMVVHLVDRR